MPHDPLLSALLQRSTLVQRVFLRGLAVVSVVFGIVLAIALAVLPAKPGEEGVIVGLGVTAVLFVIGGAGLWAWVGLLLRRLDALLARPADIRKMQLVRVKRRNLVVWTVHMWGPSFGPVGLIVADEGTGRGAIDRLRSLGAPA